jgi:hypothetical protein
LRRDLFRAKTLQEKKKVRVQLAETYDAKIVSTNKEEIKALWVNAA